MIQFDIIMLSCGKAELTRRCVESVIQNSHDHRLFWLDNDPDNSGQKETFESLGWPAVRSISYYAMPENLGFTKATNVGLALSTAPFVVMLNDDTEVPFRWLDRLREAFERIPRLAAIGPMSSSPEQWQYMGNFQQDPGAPLTIEPRFTLSHPAIGGPVLAFFCAMFSREALVEVGYLDERFSPGYGEDDDWIFRAHRLGWKQAVHAGVLVKHVRHATWADEQRAALQARNARLLREKWSAVLS